MKELSSEYEMGFLEGLKIDDGPGKISILLDIILEKKNSQVSEKVYCDGCRHFSRLISEKCVFKENILVETLPDTYIRPGVNVETHLKEPKFINKNNDCSWFEKKENKKWWRVWG